LETENGQASAFRSKVESAVLKELKAIVHFPQNEHFSQPIAHQQTLTHTVCPYHDHPVYLLA
jgi:hypothetical protein